MVMTNRPSSRAHAVRRNRSLGYSSSDVLGVFKLEEWLTCGEVAARLGYTPVSRAQHQSIYLVLIGMVRDGSLRKRTTKMYRRAASVSYQCNEELSEVET